MSESHVQSHDYFDLVVKVDDEGNVGVAFHDIPAGKTQGQRLLLMPWDEFREVIDFVCVHGLKMSQPYVCEYEEVEGAAEGAAA